MDPSRFDILARSLSQPASRRGALGVLGGAMALLGEAVPGLAKSHQQRKRRRQRRAAAGQEKYVLCHKGREIEVAASAVPGHFAHGDTPGLCSGVGWGDECVPLLHLCNNNGNDCCGDNAQCTSPSKLEKALTFCLDRPDPTYPGCSSTAQCQERFPNFDIECAPRGLLTCPSGVDMCCQPKACSTNTDCPIDHTCCGEVGGKHCCGPNQVCDVLFGCLSTVP